MKISSLIVALAVACALAPQPAAAQNRSAESVALANCLTTHASEADRIALMRWMFVAMARHPSVSNYANIPDAERVATNRTAGQLFNRLVLEDCPNQTRAAFRAGGEGALEGAFATLGEIAMVGIMGHADVAAATAEMGSYMDQQRMGQLLTQ